MKYGIKAIYSHSYVDKHHLSIECQKTERGYEYWLSATTRLPLIFTGREGINLAHREAIWQNKYRSDYLLNDLYYLVEEMIPEEHIHKEKIT